MAKRPFRDKMLSKAPVGYGLTQPDNPWAKPPKYNTAEEFVQSVCDGLMDENKRDRCKAYILAGLPVTTMTEAMILNGFSENLFNPDVAELSKPALNMLFTAMAVEDDYMGPFRLSPEPVNQQEIDDEKLNENLKAFMQENNPILAKAITMQQDELDEQEMKAKEEEILSRQKAARTKPTEGFIEKREAE